MAGKEGLPGSFFTGVLATVVATPCTAPFMGGAVGYALSQPPLALVAVFLSLGFGLALPYLALSMGPALQRLLPRPGIWMERVKQAFAFPMYGAAAWLVWVLAQQAGAKAVAVALAGLVVIGFAAWVYGTSRSASLFWQRSGLVLVYKGGIDSIASTNQQDISKAEPYVANAIKSLVAGHPIAKQATRAYGCSVKYKS